MYVYTYIYIYVCMYVCTYVCMYTWIIHIWRIISCDLACVHARAYAVWLFQCASRSLISTISTRQWPCTPSPVWHCPPFSSLSTPSISLPQQMQWGCHLLQLLQGLHRLWVFRSTLGREAERHSRGLCRTCPFGSSEVSATYVQCLHVVCVHACRRTFRHACVHACVHVCTCACLHAYIHTYLIH